MTGGFFIWYGQPLGTLMCGGKDYHIEMMAHIFP